MFAGQHTNAAANARRKMKRQIGARQFRKLRKELAREARSRNQQGTQ